jgi:pyroglutamyl-peptidase
MLVTAFGPFDGRTMNASLLALRALRETLPWIHTRILPVDSVLAPMRMKRAIRQVCPDVVLMLGEAAGSKTIRLERTAHNELDFAIPDNAGRQPRALPVVFDAPETLCSSLPLEPLLAVMEEAGHNATISDNAGRYLCNQIMFQTLHHFGRHAPLCMAGFIHLPFAGDCPTAKVVDALGLVIREVVRTRGGAGSFERPGLTRG